MYDFLFDLMVRDPTIVPLEPVNVVLSASRVDSKVKEFGIGITLSDFCDTRACFFRAISIVARLMTRHLRRAQRSLSSTERARESWAMSGRRMTRRASWRCNFALRKAPYSISPGATPFAWAYGKATGKAPCAHVAPPRPLTRCRRSPGDKTKNSRIWNILVALALCHRQGVEGNDPRAKKKWNGAHGSQNACPNQHYRRQRQACRRWDLAARCSKWIVCSGGGSLWARKIQGQHGSGLGDCNLHFFCFYLELVEKWIRIISVLVNVKDWVCIEDDR